MEKNSVLANALANIRVVIPEHRYPEQLTKLLEREGATVISCPLVRETPLEESEGPRRFIELCETTVVDYVVFFTGVGVDLLFRAINRPDVLSRSKILARGPKAVAALKRAGVQIDMVADQPTSEGILQTLARHDLQGKSVLIQLYGEENPEICSALEAMGARVTAISLYRYSFASDHAAVDQLLKNVLAGDVDAICFTSAHQIRFLMDAAVADGRDGALRNRLRDGVVIVAIGEVTARALEAAGLNAQVIPQDPRMGPMVRALAEFFDQRRT